MNGGATHESLDKTEVIRPPTERSFGYTFAVVFSLLAAFTWWHSGVSWKFYSCLSVVAVFGAAICYIISSAASTSLVTASPLTQSKTLQRIDGQLRRAGIQTYPRSTLHLQAAYKNTEAGTFVPQV